MKTRNPKSEIRTRSGFTLVELVIAVVITGVAVYALLTVFINAATKNVDLEALSIGYYLANAKLEEVSNRSYSSITEEAVSAFDGGFGDFDYEVEFDYVSSEALDVPTTGTGESYKRIKVRVTSNSLPSSIEVVTLATDASNE